VGELTGRRILVVGASKGIGRGVSLRLDREGARLAVAARSLDLLDALASECQGEVVALPCDVTVGDSCREAVAAAAEHLGGLDALVYATGMGVVSSLENATHEHWVTALQTNVIGASVVTAAAAPHLAAADGVAIYFSSVSAQLTPPWTGLGVYLASKVALEKVVQVWTLEEPKVRFTTIVVGSTSGGNFFTDAIVPVPEDLDRFRAEWEARGYLADEQLGPEDQAQAVVDVITSRAQIDTIWVRPRSIMQLPAD
jgi:NAD(P)-dependent dehydrogenase (short-subunit alcohol dehydrogenase family)